MLRTEDMLIDYYVVVDEQQMACACTSRTDLTDDDRKGGLSGCHWRERWITKQAAQATDCIMAKVVLLRTQIL